MKNFILTAALALVFTIAYSQDKYSPKTPKETPETFNEKFYKTMLSKRLKRTIKQRDSLDVLAANYQKDTTQRGVNYRKLKNELITCEKKYESLNKDHSELIASSLNTSDKLNKALEQKQKDLEEKEKLLREREKNLRELKAIIARQDSVADALNQLVKKALLGFNSDEFTTEIKNGKVYVSLANKLLFQSGKAEIEDKGKDALKKLAQALSKNNDINLDVEGHTDNVPIKTAQFRDNWDLSVARALNVLKVLESEQVPSNRLTASGKGEYSPKADNATAEGRALNRRTEIILSPKLDMLFQMFELNKK